MTAPMIFAADRSHWAGLVCFRGMRTRSSVQQGLSLIRTLAAWRSGSCPPSLQPCNQVPIRCRPWAPRPHTVPFLPTRRCSNASAWAHVGEERKELEHEGPEQEQEQQELEQELEQEQEDEATGADENGSSSSKQAKCTTTLVDYLSLTDKELLAQCVVDTFRASGPGGQHRNKTDSAVRLKHSPTGLGGQASDERSQHVNKLLALDRLRQSIASKVRRPVDLANYAPPPELLIILPPASTVKKEHGLKQQIGPKNKSYVLGMQALLDLLYAANGSVSETAVPLGLSTGMLSKLITSDKTLWVAANAIRAEKGLKPLR